MTLKRRVHAPNQGLVVPSGMGVLNGIGVMTGYWDKSMFGSMVRLLACIQHFCWKYGLMMMYQPGTLPIPTTCTCSSASMLLSKP